MAVVMRKKPFITHSLKLSEENKHLFDINHMYDEIILTLSACFFYTFHLIMVLNEINLEE